MLNFTASFPKCYEFNVKFWNYAFETLKLKRKKARTKMTFNL